MALQFPVGGTAHCGGLRKLGITVAKSTVEKYRPRVRTPASPTWKTFLTNHVYDIVACDFFGSDKQGMLCPNFLV